MDEETWDAYAPISSHLACLQDWLKRGQYWPQPVRRVYIPKDEHSKRPLGIPTIQDKLLQFAMARILEAIFEGDFLPVSMAIGLDGMRIRRSCHRYLPDDLPDDDPD